MRQLPRLNLCCLPAGVQCTQHRFLAVSVSAWGSAACIGECSQLDPSTCLDPACSEEEMAAELEEIRGMWEMASILDFVELFK